MTSCRREVRLNTYPQGPAGDPGRNGRRSCSTGELDIYQGGKSNVSKGNSWHRWSFLSSAVQHVQCGKYPLCLDMMRRDRGQAGWEGFDVKGQNEEAINIFSWTKGHKTLRHRLERRKRRFFVFKELTAVSTVSRWQGGLAKSGSKATGLLWKDHSTVLRFRSLIWTWSQLSD